MASKIAIDEKAGKGRVHRMIGQGPNPTTSRYSRVSVQAYFNEVPGNIFEQEELAELTIVPGRCKFSVIEPQEKKV